MSTVTLKTYRGTADVNAALNGVQHIWGIIARNSGTSTAAVAIYDALTVTGNPVINIAANTGDGTNYEEMFGIMFPRAVRVSTGVTVDVTNVDEFFIYYS